MEPRKRHVGVVVVALAASLVTAATSAIAIESSSDGATGATQSPSSRFGARFATLAGSRENAIALANALHDATPVTLAYATTSPQGGVPATVTFAAPTAPMAWRDVWYALAIAEAALVGAGIANPTGGEVQAALVGGSVSSDARATLLPGVLRERADGMAWVDVAQSHGTTLAVVSSRTAVSPPTTNAPVAMANGIRGTFMPASASGIAARATFR